MSTTSCSSTKPDIRIPGGSVNISHCAETLFQQIRPQRVLFNRGAELVEVIARDGEYEFNPINAAAAVSRFEDYARFVRTVRREDGEAQNTPTTLTEKTAKLLLETRQRRAGLDTIRGVLQFPLLVERDSRLVSLEQGFDPESGLFIASVEPLVEMKRCEARTPGPFRYLRYCDDMVILAPSQETCRVSFEVYQQALQRLRLPIHQPTEIAAYDAQFWNGKSRQPYLWAQPSKTNTVPWLQFVGYQIRHDGMLRVKSKSIAKHKAKILKETNRLLRTLNPTYPAESSPPIFAPGIRKSKQQIIHRFRQKLIAMSVGRREVHHDLRQAMPKCWATGFKMAHGQHMPFNALKELDRFRERQIGRIHRRLSHLSEPAQSPEDGERGKNFRPPGYYGFPFSYVAQFAPTGRVPTERRR